MGPAFPSVSQPVLPTCFPAPLAFPFPSQSRAAPRPSPAADLCRSLCGSYFYPSVGAEVLQGGSEMARAEVGRVIMLEGATSSPSLICNELWRLLSQELRGERLGIVPEVLHLVRCRWFGAKEPSWLKARRASSTCRNLTADYSLCQRTAGSAVITYLL